MRRPVRKTSFLTGLLRPPALFFPGPVPGAGAAHGPAHRRKDVHYVAGAAFSASLFRGPAPEFRRPGPGLAARAVGRKGDFIAGVLPGVPPGAALAISEEKRYHIGVGAGESGGGAPKSTGPAFTGKRPHLPQNRRRLKP